MMTALNLDTPANGTTNELRARANALRVAIDRIFRYGRASGRPDKYTLMEALECIEQELARRAGGGRHA